jgi:hypothetical protein
VGRGAFADLGSEDVTIRVLRRPLPERDAPAGGEPPRQAYASRVRRVAGDVQLIPVEPRGELAPLVQPRESVP